MKYYAAEPSGEEVVVETLEKDDSEDDEVEPKEETKTETVIEEVEEDASVSVEWSLDEEKSSKTEFKDLVAGEKYIFVPTITEDGYKIADDVELPTITVTVEENVSSFEQSVTVDGVVITVTADEGVFPEGASVSARKVSRSEANEVTEAIDEVRDNDKNVALSYTFDITISDKDGNEIEPDTEKGSVKVSFKMAEIANSNLETDVYHVEETDGGLNAESLGTSEEAYDEVVVETDGFSYYTVEFTYGELQYVLPGDSRVELTTILDTIGIDVNGEITEVTGSNDSLFKPVNEDGTWYIEAVTAFTSKEWLKVKIGEAEYEIVVTDATGTGKLTDPVIGDLDCEKLVASHFYQNGKIMVYSAKVYLNGNKQEKYAVNFYSLPSKLYFETLKEGPISSMDEYYFLSVTEHTITYDLNNGSGTTPSKITYGVLSDGNYVKDDGGVKQSSISYTVSSTVPTRSGYTFLGWNTKSDGTGTDYSSGASITPGTSDIVLYAKWKLDAFKVSFDTKGGENKPDDQNVNSGAKATRPSQNPTKADNKFLGWTTDSTAATTSTLFDFENTPITAVTTLYAIWEPHDHVWAYAADGNKLCAYCTVDGYNCSYYGTESDLSKAITVEVNAPEERSGSLTYDGNDYVAILTDAGNKWSTTFSSLPSIEYGYKEFGMEAASYSSVTDTKDAGYYKASITVGDKTAYKEYQIAKKTSTIDLSMTDYEVGGTPSTPVLSGKESDGSVTYSYKKKDASDSTYTTTAPTTPWGDYTVKADVAETKNYASASKTYDFQITPKYRTGIINTIMSGYVYGTTTVPTPSTNPVASELEENPSVTYKYRVLGSTDEWIDWTGDSSALDVLSDTGKYEMIAVIGATATYAERQSSSVRFTVTKGEWKVTAPTTKTLKYNCADQDLVNAGSVEDGGEMLYSLDGAAYNASISKATNAGTYDVYYKIEADTNHNEYVCDSPISVTIAKADWNVTAPTAINPSVTGVALELVNAGVVKDADNSTVTDKLLYSLNGTDYSTTIPTATTVGSYTVYYKVAGDDNHNEYAAKTMTATIEKISRTDTPTVSMEGYTYGQTGSIPAPSLSTTPSENPTVTYYYNSTDSFDGASEWKNITATTLNAGTYYMFAKLSETTSYRSCNTEGAEFTIAKATCTVTAPTGKTLKYNGQDQELVNAGSVIGGTMLYSLDDATYSANLPKAMDRGDYTIHYYALGDANHESTAKQTVTATIGKGEHSVTAPRALNPVYNGSEQVLISAGSCTSGTILYSLDGETYFDSINEIKGKDIASYTVYYKVEGNDNYVAFAPQMISANIVKKVEPTPIPKPNPQPNPQPSQPVVKNTQFSETGSPIKNYVINDPNGGNMPLPYITTDGSKAGWMSIDEALDAHKAKYKKNTIGTLSITMNGNATVDTKLITDAHEKKIPLSFVLDDEVTIGIPVSNSVLSEQVKAGKTTYFRVSSMTTAEAVSVKRTHAGLLPSDIVAIGGNENTPVVLTFCSNDKLSTNKSQLITIKFNAKKAGFKKGDIVYLYCGTSTTGIAMYKAGKVDKNGFVTFTVPMVSNYWTIGSKDMKNTLLRNNVALPR